MNILLTVSYDGTKYCGWQRQENAVAVQEMLELAIRCVFGEEIKTVGASRTDSGVHALGQAVAFKIDKCPIPMEKLPQVLNSALPKDIVVRSAAQVDESFNPRFDAKRKTYCYKIYNSDYPNPMILNYTEYIKVPLDIDKMKEASLFFIGTHDFKAFSSSGSNAKTTIRTIYDITIAKEKNTISMFITGDSFLYNMVRIMAGTLIDAGLGKLQPNIIEDIILSKERKRASRTAVAGGLTLLSVEF